MQLELDGKVALVTGSSRGLGRAIALDLHAEGCTVAVNGRSEQPLEQLAGQLGERASAHAADVTDPAQCDALVSGVIERWNRLDILVCNVGSGRSVPPGAETHEEWRRVFEINFWSATNMVKAATAALSETAGAIVCISSICGVEQLGAPLTYSAAKSALNSYVSGAARHLGRSGVRINAVAPGNLLFEGSVWERKRKEDAGAVDAMLERDVALRRLGTPADIASFVSFLASPRAAFATGAVFVVDGGQVRHTA